MRKVIFVTLLLAMVYFCHGQKPNKAFSKIYFLTELSYLDGLSISGAVNASDPGYAVGLRIGAGFIPNSKWSFGLGGGLDGYHNPNYNTVPLFVDIRHLPALFGGKWILALKGGFTPGDSNSLSKGVFLEPSIGYTLLQLKKVDVNLSLVYKSQRIDHQLNMNGDENRVRINSLGFNVSFVW